MNKVVQFLQRSELGQLVWQARKEFMWVGIFSCVYNLLMITPTLYMLQVFDRVMLSKSEVTLIVLTLLMLGGLMLSSFADWIRTRVLVRTTLRFDQKLNSRILMACFDSRRKGTEEKAQSVFNDLTSMRQLISSQSFFTVFDIPWTPVYLGVLFLMHPVLGWTGLVFMALFAMLAYLSNQWTEKALEDAMEAHQLVNAYVGAKLKNSEIVESLGMLGNLRMRWLHLYMKHLKIHNHSQDNLHKVQMLSKLVRQSQQSIVLSVGAYLVIQGELSSGAMVASNMMMSNALRPIDMLVSSWRMFVQAKTSYLRVEKMLEENPAKQQPALPQSIKGAMQWQNLGATVPSKDEPILEGLNARFEPGQVVAIAGHSGAGKTTLLRCILGISQGILGHVKVNQQDVTHMQRDALGAMVGYLPQDIELMEGTIAENIARFGEVNSEAVIEAAQKVGIHQMILRMPKGYDTAIGEAGGFLSGGQRQRLALARAIYGNPQLLVLDEPNANMDEQGTAALVTTLNLMKSAGALIFMVAHDRNLLATADRLVVLAKGKMLHNEALNPEPHAVPVA
jgi:ATP-binding cassette, subfamily C, bacterial exporter for protease/lipase